MKDLFKDMPRESVTLKDYEESVHQLPLIDILIVEVRGGPLDGTVRAFRDKPCPVAGDRATGHYGVCSSEDFPKIEKFLESHLTNFGDVVE